jgi:hypothetical protein
VFTVLHVRASLLLVPAFDAAGMLRNFACHRASVFMGAPAMCRTRPCDATGRIDRRRLRGMTEERP